MITIWGITMDSTESVKKSKAGGAVVKTAPVRVSKETRKRIVIELARLNKKELGRSVKPDDLITLALTLLEPKHYAQLQDSTHSNADRLQRRYLAYVKEHGAISKDTFIGKLLTGEIVSAPVPTDNGRQNPNTSTAIP